MAAWRVVAVPVPIGDGALARVFAMLEANPGQWFTPEDLGARLQMQSEIVRQQCNDLKQRGLVEAQPRTGNRTWLYRVAPDFSDVLAPLLAKRASEKDAA